MITQNFDQIANWILSDSEKSEPTIEYYPKIGREAALQFSAQNVIYRLLMQQHYDQAEDCKCEDCESKIIHIIYILSFYPEAYNLVVNLVKMAPFIVSPSLKERCMRKVLELRLDVKWLPETVKEELLSGPAYRNNWREGLQDRMLKRLQSTVRKQDK